MDFSPALYKLGEVTQQSSLSLHTTYLIKEHMEFSNQTV
jgi:hypothetical protein